VPQLALLWEDERQRRLLKGIVPATPSQPSSPARDAGDDVAQGSGVVPVGALRDDDRSLVTKAMRERLRRACLLDLRCERVREQLC
jgi:hypothetical protein